MFLTFWATFLPRQSQGQARWKISLQISYWTTILGMIRAFLPDCPRGIPYLNSLQTWAEDLCQKLYRKNNLFKLKICQPKNQDLSPCPWIPIQILPKKMLQYQNASSTRWKAYRKLKILWKSHQANHQALHILQLLKIIITMKTLVLVILWPTPVTFQHTFIMVTSLIQITCLPSGLHFQDKMKSLVMMIQTGTPL